MNREDFKRDIKQDVDAYGKPKKLMTKIDRLFDYYENRLCKNCALLETPCQIAQVLFYDLGFGLEEISCPKFKSLGESK